jgi:hypothetical protein
MGGPSKTSNTSSKPKSRRPPNDDASLRDHCTWKACSNCTKETIILSLGGSRELPYSFYGFQTDTHEFALLCVLRAGISSGWYTRLYNCLVQSKRRIVRYLTLPYNAPKIDGIGAKDARGTRLEKKCKGAPILNSATLSATPPSKHTRLEKNFLALISNRTSQTVMKTRNIPLDLMDPVPHQLA